MKLMKHIRNSRRTHDNWLTVQKINCDKFHEQPKLCGGVPAGPACSTAVITNQCFGERSGELMRVFSWLDRE